MEDKDLRRHDMVQRVCDYGTENASFFPSTTLGGELFAKLKGEAADMSSHVAARVSAGGAARHGTASKAAECAALREILEAIRDMARAMSLTMPGLETKFRIPRNMTDQDLIATAQAFAAEAAPIKNDFLRFAMPPDFLEDLEEHLAAFVSATTAQHAGQGSRAMASAGFDDAMDRAIATVRQLDAIVRNTFRDDPARLAAWESARHVERAARRKTSKPDGDKPEAK